MDEKLIKILIRYIVEKREELLEYDDGLSDLGKGRLRAYEEILLKIITLF